MIVNFEEFTDDLSEIEFKYKDEIAELIKRYCKIVVIKNPVKQKDLCSLINTALIEKYGLFFEMKVNQVRLRKYFNYFRSNGILPIIATSDGCYISNDKAEISKQIISLEQRARQILKASEGMKTFLK